MDRVFQESQEIVNPAITCKIVIINKKIISGNTPFYRVYCYTDDGSRVFEHINSICFIPTGDDDNELILTNYGGSQRIRTKTVEFLQL